MLKLHTVLLLMFVLIAPVKASWENPGSYNPAHSSPVIWMGLIALKYITQNIIIY